MTNTVSIRELINGADVEDIKRFVSAQRSHTPSATTHNIVMKWLDSQPNIMERFRELGIIKAYGSYVLEYYLKL